MSKRKTITGGYEDSSDDSEQELANNEPTIKKVRPASQAIALPRLSSNPNLQQRGFPIPNAKPPPFGQSVSTLNPAGSFRAASVSAPPSSNVSTPGTPLCLDRPVWLDNKGSDRERAVPSIQGTSEDPVDLRGRKPTLALRTDQLLGSNRSRSTLTLERQMNEVSVKLEEYQESTNQLLQQQDKKITQLLGAVQSLAPPGRGPGSTPISPITQASPTSPNLAVPGLEGSHPMVNPPIGPELSEIVSNRCRVNAPRVELGNLKNAVIEFIRLRFKAVLRYDPKKSLIDEIKPYFLNQFGRPDTLPVQLADSNGYCTPYPHWEAQLSEQLDWIPTFLERCKATVPNDDSELSKFLLNLTDGDWVSLLYFGPFRSAQAAWKRVATSKEVVRAMRERQLNYHTTQSKAFMRADYIRESIPGLRNSTNEFITHRAYMSEEEEVDGTIIVKRPSHRSSLVNHVFTAIDVANTKTRLARSNSSPPKPRRVEIVDLPLPKLESGANKSKSIIRIPEYAISKKWRAKFPDEFTKSAHLINTKCGDKPDISAFLTQNPSPSHSGGIKVEEVNRLAQRTDNASNVGDTETEDDDRNDHDEGGMYDGAYGIRAQSHDLLSAGADQEQPLPDPLVDARQVAGPLGDSDRTEIPIDPQLLDSDEQDWTMVHHPPPPSMPPPPVLQSEADTHLRPASGVDDEFEPPRRSKRTANRANPGSKPNPTDRPEMDAGGAPVSHLQAPKKRGRTKGSKNKPKSTDNL